MNNTFYLEQIAKTGDLESDLIKRHYKFDKMAKFKEIKSINPKIKQAEKAGELKSYSFTLQRYRREIKMLPPFRIQPSSNTHTRKHNTSNHSKCDRKMSSNDLKMTSNEPVK